MTIQTAVYDGNGRRLKKVVTNSADHNGTVLYLYDGPALDTAGVKGAKISETRDGSGNMLQQFIHGTQYIDELVMMRVKDVTDHLKTSQ